MRRLLFLALVLAVGAVAALYLAARPGEAPGRTGPVPGRIASAVFAGGCFWCTESDFDHIPGVISTTSGYAGGHVANPTYEQVSEGDTGHIGAVRVVYDPARVSYASLVERFFRTIDPLDAGGSFCDRGHQYRSLMLLAQAGEPHIAEAATAQASRQLGRTVATLILPARDFYPAEDYHQDYYRKNPYRYRFYRWNCGRDARIEELWGSSH